MSRCGLAMGHALCVPRLGYLIHALPILRQRLPPCLQRFLDKLRTYFDLFILVYCYQFVAQHGYTPGALV